MRIHLFITLATLTAIPSAWTETIEPVNRGPDVLLFEHASMEGEAGGFFAGDGISSLKDIGFRNKSWNDEFSSIEIRGDVDVYLYEHDNFEGRRIHVSESVGNLSSIKNESGRYENWNDRVSSIQIEGRAPPHEALGPEHQPRAVALAYSDANYSGYALELRIGDEYPNLKVFNLGSNSWNDAISSIKVEGDVVIELFSDANFSGEMIRIDTSQNNLDRVRTIEGRTLRWNDAVSSILITRSH